MSFSYKCAKMQSGVHMQSGVYLQSVVHTELRPVQRGSSSFLPPLKPVTEAPLGGV